MGALATHGRGKGEGGVTCPLIFLCQWQGTGNGDAAQLEPAPSRSGGGTELCPPALVNT